MATMPQALSDMRSAYKGVAGKGKRAQTVENLARWFKDNPKDFMAEKRRMEDAWKAMMDAKAARQALREGGKPAEAEDLLAEEPVEGLIQELLGRMRA